MGTPRSLRDVVTPGLTGITTGAIGQPWRASITTWGAIVPWSGGPVLDWWVAADDRWHVPADEPAVRQQRIGSTPVTETRVRVPHGDVVQRVYSVADAGGLTVVEVENESTLPVAIAFGHRDVLTERPVADVPIAGIDLPTGAFVTPLAHRATVRVALAHAESRPGRLPAGLPTATQVVRGWLALTERASRFVLPDGDRCASVAESVTATRCELALGAVPGAADDPAGFLLALGELIRMGERPDTWLPELVEAVAAVGPDPGWPSEVALASARRVLAAAGEDRAIADLDRIVARRRLGAAAPAPADPPGGVADVPWLERRFADGGVLLPGGLPEPWWGVAVDVYGIPAAGRSSVSFALRWHGDRPAVLWEQVGPPIELTAPSVAPGWTTVEASGEALWPAPRRSGR